MYFDDATDYGVVSKNVIIVVAPLAGGGRSGGAFEDERRGACKMD
jgi:hypothetical protein